MIESEIKSVLRRYRMRLKTILTSGELATYEAFQQRVQAGLARGSAAPVPPTPSEQAVLAKIEADLDARSINKQFFALIRVEHPSQ